MLALHVGGWMRRRRETGETRKLIIEAAHRVFCRSEYAEVTVNDILQEAGVSRGTYYGYFSDKESAFAAVWREVAEGTRREMRLPKSDGRYRVPHETDPTQLRGLVYERILVDIRLWRREPNFMRATIVFRALRPDLALPIVDESRESTRAASEWVARDKEAGFLNNIDPLVATLSLAAMLEWFLFLTVGNAFPDFPDLGDDTLAEQLTTIWFNGAYRPGNPPASLDSRRQELRTAPQLLAELPQ